MSQAEGPRRTDRRARWPAASCAFPQSSPKHLHARGVYGAYAFATFDRSENPNTRLRTDTAVGGRVIQLASVNRWIALLDNSGTSPTIWRSNDFWLLVSFKRTPGELGSRWHYIVAPIPHNLSLSNLTYRLLRPAWFVPANVQDALRNQRIARVN